MNYPQASLELTEHASTDFGHVNIVNGEAPAIDADGWRFLYGEPGTPLTAGKFHLYEQDVKCGAEKPRPGTTGASAALPACRSDRRMCIVGGHNDAADILQQFYLDCNLYLSLNHEYGQRVEQRRGGSDNSAIGCDDDAGRGNHQELIPNRLSMPAVKRTPGRRMTIRQSISPVVCLHHHWKAARREPFVLMQKVQI